MVPYYMQAPNDAGIRLPDPTTLPGRPIEKSIPPRKDKPQEWSKAAGDKRSNVGHLQSRGDNPTVTLDPKTSRLPWKLVRTATAILRRTGEARRLTFAPTPEAAARAKP